MSRSKPKRRWLQFSLRSVLLLTLAVALWLGYEVHQARRVEQTVAALRELGGNAECELTGWSLLRLCRVPGYGQRIVRADIPGSAAEEAIGLLRDSAGLREVQVTYDGTYDPAPSWKALIGALPTASIQPSAEEESDNEAQFHCFGRLAAKMMETYPSVVDLGTYQTGPWSRMCYGIVRLPDNALVEVFSGMAWWVPGPTLDAHLAILVVDDKCVGVRVITTLTEVKSPEIVLADLDGDGVPELGFRWTEKLSRDPRIRRLPGDSRDWLGVYKIERDGFTSLLPEDNSDFSDKKSNSPNVHGESTAPPARPPGPQPLPPDTGR